MSKAILVIDMPEVCANCPINFWNRCGILEHESKLSGCIENPSYGRLDKCPLKPMPEKKEGYDSIRYQWGEYEDGWNHCIEYILDT